MGPLHYLRGYGDRAYSWAGPRKLGNVGEFPNRPGMARERSTLILAVFVLLLVLVGGGGVVEWSRDD